MKEIFTLGFLKIISQIMVVLGAVGSLALPLNEGRQTPVFLLILFVGWVLSPFIALLVVNAMSKRWTVITRLSIYFLMLFFSIGSLVRYSRLFNLPETKPAFVFLVVPLISWLLILFVIPIAQKMSGKKNSFLMN